MFVCAWAKSTRCCTMFCLISLSIAEECTVWPTVTATFFRVAMTSSASNGKLRRLISFVNIPDTPIQFEVCSLTNKSVHDRDFRSMVPPHGALSKEPCCCDAIAANSSFNIRPVPLSAIIVFGRTLVTASDDYTIRVWDIVTKETTMELTGPIHPLPPVVPVPGPLPLPDPVLIIWVWQATRAACWL